MKKSYELIDAEIDITINPEIRKLFFKQLKERDFECESYANDFFVKVNLNFPKNSGKPFLFRLDVEKNIVIPQFTKTRRFYAPVKDSEEFNILKDTILYIQDYFSHPRKALYKKMNESNNIFIGKFSGVKSHSHGKGIISYEISKNIGDFYKDKSFSDSFISEINKDTYIKNIYIYNTIDKSIKENIIYIKILQDYQYRILINPIYEDICDVNLEFLKDTIKIDFIANDTINLERISLVCKG